MYLKEIAARINKHLRRLEADPKINRPQKTPDSSKWGTDGVRPYYHASASVEGRYVGVTYVSYHLTSKLNKADAARYLEWLDAGHVGTHHEALK